MDYYDDMLDNNYVLYITNINVYPMYEGSYLNN